jgi:hypothetical protein
MKYLVLMMLTMFPVIASQALAQETELEAMVMKKPVVCGKLDNLVRFVEMDHGEKPVMGWIDGKTNQTVVFYYNHETKSSTVIERLPGAAPGTPDFGCIISGGKDYFISKKFLEQQLGDAI